MSIACLFSGLYCEADEIASIVLDRTGARSVSDREVVARAASLSGMDEDRIAKAFFAGTSIFNRFSHEKERSVSWLRLAAAEILAEGGPMVMHGFSAQLPPDSVSHVLRTCIIAGLQHRADVAEKAGVTQAEAKRHIHKGDEDRAAWTEEIRGSKDPWDTSLYDLVIPVDKTGVADAAEQILTQLANPAVKPTAASERAVQDFLLASRVETFLGSNGHHVEVHAKNQEVTIVIHKNVLMLERLERELKELAEKVEGVKSVETKVGPDFHKSDIYRKVDFEVPSKVLLVDDEREFVQTLSERLLLRDMGSAVAYDGESALDIVSNDDPEVIVLDLKMPGIDGIEVLRRIKENRPEVQVIILTGHGSEEDRDVCMKLGAFAYLHKPVDIETLSETIKKANEAR